MWAQMKKIAKQPVRPPAPLTPDALAQVSGGEDIISPRDPASGLPTGKRMH